MACSFKVTTVTTAMIIDIRTTTATDTPTITDAEFELLFSAEERKKIMIIGSIGFGQSL